MNDSNLLSGRVAVVTGAASGIGYATTLLFAEHGAQVVCVDINASGFESLQRRAGVNSDSLRFVTTDVSRIEGARDIAVAAVQLGKVHILFNNAGMDVRGRLEHTREEDWDRIMDVNVKSMFLITRELLPHFDRDGLGSIVNTASAAALHPISDRLAYVASKGAVVAFTKALALDLAEENIRVNCICPGAVETPLLESSFAAATNSAEARKKVEGRYPMKRLAQPEEVARAVLFLASSESSYITGATLAVDAGRTMH